MTGLLMGHGLVSVAAGQRQNMASSWQERLAEAIPRTDALVLGTVSRVRNYLPVDGGYGYDIAVSEVLKGPYATMLSVRAGGWTQTVRFQVGDRVLLFLCVSEDFHPSESHVLVEDGVRNAFAFRVSGERTVPANQVHPPVRGGPALEEVRDAVQAAAGPKAGH